MATGTAPAAMHRWLVDPSTMLDRVPLVEVPSTSRSPSLARSRSTSDGSPSRTCASTSTDDGCATSRTSACNSRSASSRRWLVERGWHVGRQPEEPVRRCAHHVHRMGACLLADGFDEIDRPPQGVAGSPPRSRRLRTPSASQTPVGREPPSPSGPRERFDPGRTALTWADRLLNLTEVPIFRG